MVRFAEQFRQEQIMRPKPDRVRIGGHLVMSHIRLHGIVTQRAARFPSYTDDWNAAAARRETQDLDVIPADLGGEPVAL